MSEEFRVIDLFAGVGGLSLGAARAGFEVAAAVEIDKHALAFHGINFPRSIHIDKDVSSLVGSDLLETAKIKKEQLSGLIGGPPCQGFSTIGRREVSDPRNNLFSRFFELVADLDPAFFLAENVPGILGERNDAIRKAALSKIPKKYTVLPPLEVRASSYGAPTIRTRVFFIGYDPGRVNSLSLADFLPRQDICEVKVSDAFKGLPNLGAVWDTGDGIYKVDLPGDSYFESRLGGVIPNGVGHKDSIDKLVKHRLVSGFLSTSHTTSTINRFSTLSYGKADKISKSVRLDPQGFCPTLRAGTGPEKGSYQAVRPVHPDFPRVINPREAARLQGFPDWFQFHNSKWHAFRQIGNSVSPIVAEEILRVIRKAIK